MKNKNICIQIYIQMGVGKNRFVEKEREKIKKKTYIVQLQHKYITLLYLCVQVGYM